MRFYTRMVGAALAITAAISLRCAMEVNASLVDLQQMNEVSSTLDEVHTLKYPASNNLFPSSGLAHLEPVKGYTIKHVDNLHLHKKHQAGELPEEHVRFHSQNAVNSLGAHSILTREWEGLDQPYPDEVTIEFHAFGRRFYLPQMQLMTALYTPGSKTTVEDHIDPSNTYQVPNVLQSYHLASESLGLVATATVHTNGWIHALIHEYDSDGNFVETYQVSPLLEHRQHFSSSDPAALEMLEQEAEHDLVVFRYSDLDDMSETHQCGSAMESVDEEGNKKITLSSEPLNMMHPGRKLLVAIGQGITRWTNCYSGDTKGHKLSMGIAADVSYFELYKTVAGTQAQISATMANINLVYMAQFNAFLQVDATNIKSTTGGESWNQKPSSPGGRCSTDPSSKLNSFTSWRSSTMKGKNSLWHLFTNCYPPSGVVGIAWISVICRSNGAGLSSVTRTHWLVAAHEIGHNFGGNHAFQLGQGKTGGIMDYGDGIWPLGSGIYQFNTVYNKAEMCKEMARGFPTTGITPFCTAAYTGNCGNGVIETGEDCDDKSSCCVSCKYKSGGVCTPGSDGSNICCDATTCQFKASSTTCGALNSSGKPSSYCKNGVCTPSACTSSSGLSFCGMKSGNACRQQCSKSGGTCTDALTTPNLNVPDGTVCSTSPYGTCKSGACSTGTTPAPSNTWKTSNPSACSCSGMRTLTVQCVDAAGQVLASSQCTGNPPSNTQSCTPPSSCAVWSTSAFGPCSNDCGQGMQSRTVTCVRVNSTVAVEATNCAAQSKPVSTQACQGLPLCPVAWVQGGFTACTKSCGGGIQTQTVTCVQTQNKIVSTVVSSACPAASKPVTQQACNTPPCAGGVGWTYGVWTACSVQCSGGTQTRTATCTKDGVAVSDSGCAGIPAPVTSQVCNTQSCAMHVWHAGDFGACSLACGSGFQTRTVQCFDGGDTKFAQPLDPDSCMGAKPESMQSCNTQPCTGGEVNLQWATTQWSKCSKDCKSGGGTSTRAVLCVNTYDTSQIHPDADCAAPTSTAGPKPATMQTCNRSSCPSFAWVARSWSRCTERCGGGQQTRRVVCQEKRSRSTVRESFCDGPQPPTIQSCNSTPCRLDVTSTWKISDWSGCSAECGVGFRTRSVECQDSNGAKVDPAQCVTEAPKEREDCAVEPCGTYWYAGEWTACSASCGLVGGTQTRTVSCLQTADDPATATPLDATECTGTKPSTSAVCNQTPCPSWTASEVWSECSARCNNGIRTRNLTCESSDGKELDHSFCAESLLPMPATQEICQTMQCPHWHRSAWGPCNQLCGGGNQTRSLVCRMPHDGVFFGREQHDTTLCPAPGSEGDSGDGLGQPGVETGQPASIQQCNINACPAYYWRLSGWSPCSTSCGAGTMTTTATCTSSTTGLPTTSDNLCLDAKPEMTQACNTALLCPVYQWVEQDWLPCSTFCGEGKQQRQVVCMDTNPMPDMNLKMVLMDDSYCSGLPSRPLTEQSCLVNDPKICWGGQHNSTGIKNGRCDSSTGQCRCRSGSIGADCTAYGEIMEVATNTAQFTDGVPLDEIIQVTWNSSFSALPTVNIILVKNFTSVPVDNAKFGSEWNTGSYLASNLPNKGFFEWTVGTIIPDLELGNGYSIRVWFSTNLWADSDEFTISDPCAYLNCGIHGLCTKGRCACTEGYDGSTCERGPCERANCRPESSACNNSAVITTPPPATPPTSGSPQAITDSICACTDGYTGAQCRTPSICQSVVCQNGGDFDESSGEVDESSCRGACLCTHFWSGSNCETCSLNCDNSGTADPDCAACSCPDGFTGKECKCRYYILTMEFNMADVADWKDEPAAIERFKRTLAQDLETAAASPEMNVQINATVLDVTFPTFSTVDAKVRFALPCADIAPLVSGGWAVAYDTVDGSTDQSSAEEDSLPVVYNKFVTLFRDTDSPLYHGQVTSSISPTYQVKAVDPTGQDELIQPEQGRDCFQVDCTADAAGGNGSSSSSGGILRGTPLILICVAGGAVFFLLLVGLFHLYRKRHLQQKLAHFEQAARQHEMTSGRSMALGQI